MAEQANIRADVWTAFRACRLWRTAGDGHVTTLASAASVREVTRGTTLAVEGDTATEFGLVVSGKARVYHLAADGKQVTFETLEAGSPYGVVAALAGGRYPANIEMSTDGTVASLPGQSLYELLDTEPQVARTIIADLANRVVTFTNVVQTLSLDVPSRVARFVFQRALKVGTPTPEGLSVELGMRKGDLAMALGTVPETLSRAFARLKDDGVLEVHGNTILVLDVRALASMSGGHDE